MATNKVHAGLASFLQDSFPLSPGTWDRTVPRILGEERLLPMQMPPKDRFQYYLTVLMALHMGVPVPVIGRAQSLSDARHVIKTMSVALDVADGDRAQAEIALSQHFASVTMYPPQQPVDLVLTRRDVEGVLRGESEMPNAMMVQLPISKETPMSTPDDFGILQELLAAIEAQRQINERKSKEEEGLRDKAEALAQHFSQAKKKPKVQAPTTSADPEVELVFKDIPIVARLKKGKLHLARRDTNVNIDALEMIYPDLVQAVIFKSHDAMAVRNSTAVRDRFAASAAQMNEAMDFKREDVVKQIMTDRSERLNRLDPIIAQELTRFTPESIPAWILEYYSPQVLTKREAVYASALEELFDLGDIARYRAYGQALDTFASIDAGVQAAHRADNEDLGLTAHKFAIEAVQAQEKQKKDYQAFSNDLDKGAHRLALKALAHEIAQHKHECFADFILHAQECSPEEVVEEIKPSKRGKRTVAAPTLA